MSDPTGQNGNISVDPLFCDVANLDLTLHADSPCAPEQQPTCGLIGALPVGCEASAVGDEVAVGRAMTLGPIIPNPCGGSTRISYVLPQGSGEQASTLDVYDPSGRQIRSLVKGLVRPGSHTTVWDVRDESGALVPSGVYFVRLAMRDQIAAGHVLVLR
jgi:hypothetical protein